MDRILTKENFEKTLEDIRKNSSKEEFERVNAIMQLNRLGTAFSGENHLLGKSFNEIFKGIEKRVDVEIIEKAKNISEKGRRELVKEIKENKSLSQKRKDDLVKKIQNQRTVANDDKEAWKINYFVDEFGDPTKNGYIMNKKPMMGKYSNSITDGSEMMAMLIITDHKNIRIKLYKYTTPVKGVMTTHYDVLVKDKDGKKHKLKATLWKNIDRLDFEEKMSKKLHAILKKGGKIQFVIRENGNLTEYKFSMTNADHYYDIYKKLHKIK